MSGLKYSYLPITYHLIPRVKGDTFRSILFKTNIDITNSDIKFVVFDHHKNVLLTRTSLANQIEKLELLNGEFRLTQFTNNLPLGIHNYELIIVNNDEVTTTKYLQGTITII